MEVGNNPARQFDLANIGEMVFLCVLVATAVLSGSIDAFEVAAAALFAASLFSFFLIEQPARAFLNALCFKKDTDPMMPLPDGRPQ